MKNYLDLLQVQFRGIKIKSLNFDISYQKENRLLIIIVETLKNIKDNLKKKNK